jgi:methylmalonyl-CoA mutase
MTNLALAALFPPATDAMWREAVARALKGGDFNKKLVGQSADGFAIQPLYPRKAGAERVEGAAPGTRWSICQRVDDPDGARASQQAMADLEGGANMLALVFAGSASARGHGINPATAPSLDALLDGVMLDMITLRIEAAPFDGRRSATLLQELATRRKITPTALTVDLGLDPVGDMARMGAGPLPFAALASNMVDITQAMIKAGFRGHFLRADGRVVHEAGGSEGQELAFVMAVAVAYLRALEAAEMPLAVAMATISFTLAVDADQFMGLAKLRALRKLMAQVQAACGLEASPIHIHAETAWRMLTTRDAPVNMLRSTIAVFASGVGGADSISVLPHSLAQGLPNAFARRVARNSQHVLLEEAHLWRVADPAAGSGGIEALTDELCAAAWEQFQAIERAGGIVAALQTGMVQAGIASTKAARAKAIATRKTPITGTSEFPNLNEKPADVFDTPRTVTADAPATTFAALIPSRLAEPFEALRDRSDAILAASGTRPRMFMANLGPISAFTARTTFARALFEAGGVEAVSNDGFWEVPSTLQGEEKGATDKADATGTTNLIALTDAFKASGASLACICSSDDVYANEAVDAAMALSACGANGVYIAGRLPDMEPALAAAGVTGAVYAGCDVLKVLEGALDVSHS